MEPVFFICTQFMKAFCCVSVYIKFLWQLNGNTANAGSQMRLSVQEQSTGSSVPFGLDSHCNKWHIDIANGRKTESIIIGAVSCFHPFNKSIREHHTLRKSCGCVAIWQMDFNQNESSTQKIQRASDERSSWQHHLCFCLCVCVAVVAAGVMSWQSLVTSWLACKSSTSLFLHPPL